MTEKLKIGVVISSTREGRIGERVTAFVKNAILKDQEVVPWTQSYLYVLNTTGAYPPPMDNIPPHTVAWKPCGFVTYAIGPMGGSRAAVQLRIFTGGMGMMAVPTCTTITQAHETLDESGNTEDDKLKEELDVTLKQVYWAARALKSYAGNNPAPNWAPS
ncbi:hypothetical protein MAR_031933 [Mya arenaria]|uniref:NADPH-dependent FMN reductase-like domain-containing protein n=1 Tax=Mya arenaria TaxID=6604 RepID=A0ABY7F7J0_MYAAR|nr:hypothetical protein MAR_031933 [Mya arenaria]